MSTPPLHPAQQQKFWNEERIEMAMVSTALDLADTQAQVQVTFGGETQQALAVTFDQVVIIFS